MIRAKIAHSTCLNNEAGNRSACAMVNNKNTATFYLMIRNTPSSKARNEKLQGCIGSVRLCIMLEGKIRNKASRYHNFKQTVPAAHQDFI